MSNMTKYSNMSIYKYIIWYNTSGIRLFFNFGLLLRLKTVWIFEDDSLFDWPTATILRVSTVATFGQCATLLLFWLHFNRLKKIKCWLKSNICEVLHIFISWMSNGSAIFYCFYTLRALIPPKVLLPLPHFSLAGWKCHPFFERQAIFFCTSLDWEYSSALIICLSALNREILLLPKEYLLS